MTADQARRLSSGELAELFEGATVVAAGSTVILQLKEGPNGGALEALAEQMKRTAIDTGVNFVLLTDGVEIARVEVEEVERDGAA